MIRKQLPQGFRDEFGALAQKKEQVSRYLLTGFHKRGYTKISTPLMEYKDVFDGYVLDSQQGVYEFVDTATGNLVLRPDLTLPIARFLSTTKVKMPKKFYYLGDVLALNQEHRGNANQVTQAGVELVGYSSIKAEIECMLIISRVNRELLGGRLYLELSDARFAESIAEALGLTADEKNALFNALFYKNLPVYDTLIQQYEGNALYPFLECWPRLFGSVEEIQGELARIILPMTAQRIVDNVFNLAQTVESISGQQVRIDFSSEAPQDYYTGITFRGYVDGVASYIVSGGRYDQLLANFQEQPECAVGMAFDIDVLTAVADIDEPQYDKALVYFEQEQWQAARELLESNDEYSVAMADSLEDARKLAKKEGVQLMIVSAEGVKVDA